MMMTNGMNMSMNNPMMMGMNMSMTDEQIKQLKKQKAAMGYMYAKMILKQQKEQEEKKAEKEGKNKPNNNNDSEPQSNMEITIKFKKGGKITKIKASPNTMVAVLLNEYFEKKI